MSDSKYLNTAHISAGINESYASYEAARNAFFTLVVHGLETIVDPSSKTGDALTSSLQGANVDAAEGIKLNVVKAPAPHFGVKTEEYRRGNEVVKFATTPEWSNGTIEVDDIVGLDTKSMLMAWQYLVYNPHTRKGGRMRDYKKRCELWEYTQDYQLIRKWELEGVFIIKLSEPDFDKENDGKRRITAELSYDRAKIIELAPESQFHQVER